MILVVHMTLLNTLREHETEKNRGWSGNTTMIETYMLCKHHEFPFSFKKSRIVFVKKPSFHRLLYGES
jgi:hypothetical protein